MNNVIREERAQEFFKVGSSQIFMPHNVSPTSGRASTAPTDFHFTKTRDAGPVHCSVWLVGSRVT